MTAFRIGGDEFALVTDISDKESVKAFAEGILSRNGEPIDCDGTSISVGLRISAVKLSSERLRYSELFGRLQSAILSARENGEVNFIEETL